MKSLIYQIPLARSASEASSHKMKFTYCTFLSSKKSQQEINRKSNWVAAEADRYQAVSLSPNESLELLLIILEKSDWSIPSLEM